MIKIFMSHSKNYGYKIMTFYFNFKWVEIVTKRKTIKSEFTHAR